MSAAAPEFLRDRLAELEVEHATLRSELTSFEADYLRVVGVVLVQVQELEARILALVAVQSGADLDREAADAAEQRFRETTTALRAIPVPAGPPPTDDLKTMFRDAAKRMHPDLMRDEGGRGHAEAFMKRLNQAYAKGDAEAIRNLVRQWETSPFAAPVTDAAADRTLAVAVEESERRLEEARDSDLAQLMEQSLQASFSGRDLLAELRQDAQARLGVLRARLAALEHAGGQTP